VQGTSQPESSPMRIRSGKPHTNKHLPSHSPYKNLESSPHKKTKFVEPSSFYALQIASNANHHIEIRFRQNDGDSLCGAGGIEWQNGIFVIISRQKVLPVTMLLHVSFCLISVTKLWDMIVQLWICKHHLHHAKVLDFKSDCKMTNELNIVWSITVEWESQQYVSD